MAEHSLRGQSVLLESSYLILMTAFQIGTLIMSAMQRKKLSLKWNKQFPQSQRAS